MPILNMENYNNQHKLELKTRLESLLEAKNLSEITLRIITDGNYPDCKSYLKSKLTHGTDIGMNVEVITVTTLGELSHSIEDSIRKHIPMIFQLPSRKEFENYYMEAMKDRELSKFDMDGFFRMEDVINGDYTFAPCTPKGVLRFLKHQCGSLRGKNVVVCGVGKLVGKPLAIMLMNEKASVSTLGSVYDKKLKEDVLKNADIVICATGVKGSVDELHLSPYKNTIVMNVGTVFDENGKLDTELQVRELPNVLFSPKIKGVGVSTVLNLLENTLNFYDKYVDKV